MIQTSKRLFLQSALYLALLLVALSASHYQIGKSYYDETAANAFYTFALARSLNAIISVIQDTDISIAPAGVGVSTSPGELLDPLNDMIERFSWLMLAVSIIVKIEGYLITAFGSETAQMLVGCSFLLASGSLLSRASPAWIINITARLFLVIVLLQLLLPATFYLNHAAKSTLFSESYQQAATTLDSAATQLKELDSASRQGEGNSFWERVWNGSPLTFLEQKIANFQKHIESWILQLIELASQFIVMTILIPLTTLWIFYRIALQLSKTDFTQVAT